MREGKYYGERTACIACQDVGRRAHYLWGASDSASAKRYVKGDEAAVNPAL